MFNLMQWFFIRSSILQVTVSKTRAILLFTMKIVEIFELHATMWSAEYQTTVLLKFLWIMHNYANGLDNQPIKIATWFSGSEVIGLH